tara:strand:- start:49 stop:822 length:774 start_codon:yes stop_codon:yes gene_type:complete
VEVKGILKRYIVTPDKHFPYADNKAIKTVCKAIEILKPDGYIDLGDTGEWASVSKWKWKNKAKPNLEYFLPEVIQEVEDVNAGMDIIDESLDKANVKEKHFCQGNHELWLDYFVESYPYLPEYSCANALGIKERGYHFHRAGDLLTIGGMSYYHGHSYGGMHHAAAHCKQYKTNIIYGHHHDIQVYSDKSADGKIMAYSIGCLKDMAREKNEFIGGRPLNWGHAFAIVDYVGRKDFFVNVVEIKHGRAIIQGEVIQS